MPRTEQSSSTERKSDYRRSPTTDDDGGTAAKAARMPIKRVQHPADRSSIFTFLERLAQISLTFLISIPSILLLTLLLPISALIRMFIRFTCRYRCPITPCTCTYLTGSDLFWLFNSNLTFFENKHDERRNLQSQPVTPIAAAVFYLEGKNEAESTHVSLSFFRHREREFAEENSQQSADQQQLASRFERRSKIISSLFSSDHFAFLRFDVDRSGEFLARRSCSRDAASH